MTDLTAAGFAVFRSSHHNPMKGGLDLIWEGNDFAEWQRTIAEELANTAEGYFIHAADYALFGGGIRTYAPDGDLVLGGGSRDLRRGVT